MSVVEGHPNTYLRPGWMGPPLELISCIIPHSDMRKISISWGCAQLNTTCVNTTM